MDFFTRFKQINSFIYMVGIVVICLVVLNSNGQSQSTLRNPVLEFCTGTWCQWCPCGDSTVINQILPAIPNAIILAYHGPANTSSDPFSFFPGNGIISSLGLSAYPTGVVDRVSGIVNWNTTWTSTMNSRAAVQATVSIDIDRSYNPVTREFNATLNFTALQALSGEYRYSIILTEDGIVWAQTSNNTCTPGTASIPNYIHEWLVREVMTGVAGEMVVNGTWNANETISKTFNYFISVPQAGAPDIIPDSCNIVVMVYKQGAPLNVNAEIQQAEEFPLISPNYAATMSTGQNDFLAHNTEIANSNLVIKNEGLLADKYYITLNFEGPAGWTQSFTTVNGTFGPGDIDSVEVLPGDSTLISVEINPNSENGYGKTEVEFWSKNSPSTFGSTMLRFTTFGLDILVVDDESENYETYFTDELDNLGKEYGVVSSTAVPAAAADLYTFDKIMWMCADTKPTVTEDDRTALATYLDSGGNLYLSGLDVAYELADPASPTYTTGSYEFYTNYLHASYIKRIYTFLFVVGIPDDPITGTISQSSLFGGTGASTVNPLDGKFPNQISPGDVYADSIFHFITRPNDFAGIRAVHHGTSGTGRVVFTSFGFETIAEDSNRTGFAAKIIEWFDSVLGIDDPEAPAAAMSFELKPNYPNPFNPSTTISYLLPVTEGNRDMSLVIYNQLGQKVRTLVQKAQPAGSYEVEWNGLDDAGRGVASGIYFYQLRYGKFQANRKMLLLR